MAIQRWEMILSARADSYLLKIQGERDDVDKIVEAHSTVCRDIQEISDDVFKWAVFIVDAPFAERLAIQNLVMSLTEDSGGKAASSELTEVLDGLSGALEDLTNLTEDEQAFVMKKMARMGNPAEASGAKSPTQNPSGPDPLSGRQGSSLSPPPHAKPIPGPHISKPLPPPVIPGSSIPGRPPGGPLPPVGPIPSIVRPIQPPRPLPPASTVPGSPEGPKGPSVPFTGTRKGPVSIPPLLGKTPLTPPPTSSQNPAGRPRTGGPTPPPAPPALPHPPWTPPPAPQTPMEGPGDKGQLTGSTPPVAETELIKPPPPPPVVPPQNSMEGFSIEVGWSGGKPGAQRIDPTPPSPAGAAGGTLPPKIELTKIYEEMVPPDSGKPVDLTGGPDRPPTPGIEPLAFVNDTHLPEAVKPVVTPFGPAVPTAGPDPATAPPPDVPRTPRPVNDSVLRICVFYPMGGEADKDRFLMTLTETAQKKSKKPMTLEIISAVPTTIALEHSTDWIWTAKAGGAECFFVLLPNQMMAENMEPLHGEARDAGLGCFILEHAEIGAKLRYMDLMMDLMMLKRKGK